MDVAVQVCFMHAGWLAVVLPECRCGDPSAWWHAVLCCCGVAGDGGQGDYVLESNAVAGGWKESQAVNHEGGPSVGLWHEGYRLWETSGTRRRQLEEGRHDADGYLSPLCGHRWGQKLDEARVWNCSPLLDACCCCRSANPEGIINGMQ